MAYAFSITRTPIRREGNLIIAMITRSECVGEGSIDVANEAGLRVVKNHLAFRSDVTRNGDSVSITSGFRYSVQWKRTPRGKHADKFRMLQRDVIRNNDLSHLEALEARLGREKQRLANATNDNEANFRRREIASCEKEIAGEYKFLGIEPLTLDEILMSDDELLTALDPQSDPEIIEGLGQFKAGRGDVVTAWHDTREEAIAEFWRIAK